MPICFFNTNYEIQYRCQYSMQQECITVNVEYDIGQEIESKNGMRVWAVGTKFDNRDILVVDMEKNKSYLLKNAYYTGNFERYGLYDSMHNTSFESHICFISTETNALMKLPPMPKIKKIQLYSKAIIEHMGHPSVSKIDADNECSIIMSKSNNEKRISLNVNNIKNLALSDDWNSRFDLFSVSVEITGYLELELSRRINYTEAYNYIYEVMIYMQLFRPGKFHIDKIFTEIDGCIYEFFIALREPKYTERERDYSTKLNLLDFLKECYNRIPYRKSKDEIRNIPYVVMNSYRSIEDNFLMLFRFVECFYKRKGIRMFMTKCFQEHYKETHNISDEQIDNYAQEIICLRNHYVHSGYFIKNGSLRIRCGNEEKSKKYIVAVDFKWIHERTKMLYTMVIDIIFVEMLGIKEYKYDRSLGQ